MAAVTAEKDSLLLQLAGNARLMSEISAELVRVGATPAVDASSAEAPIELDDDAILAGIQELTARVLESEERLAKTQERLDALSRLNTQMAGEFMEFQEAAADFESTIANQKQTIEALTNELNRVRERNVQLAAETAELEEEKLALTEEKLALADTISAMEDRDNTVYYVIGTKDELLERGVIEEQGGSRVLFIFGKRGETIVPARDLDSAQFTPIDKRYVLDIPMPWADRAYRIVSRQDIASLAVLPDENGEIRGTLRIADPERFWQASRFLILVET